MYLFVYRSFKHDLPSWDRRKNNLESTHAQFDLPMLRKNLKKRFTLHGYSTHPLHKLTESVGLSKRTEGHFIALDCKKTAVWLKLNYDALSRQDPQHGRELTYTGAYHDIKDADIAAFQERSIDIKARTANLSHQISKVNMLRNHQDNIMRGMEFTDIPVSTINALHKCKSELTLASNALYQVQSKVQNEYSALQLEVSNYLDAHKLS